MKLGGTYKGKIELTVGCDQKGEYTLILQPKDELSYIIKGKHTAFGETCAISGYCSADGLINYSDGETTCFGKINSKGEISGKCHNEGKKGSGTYKLKIEQTKTINIKWRFFMDDETTCDNSLVPSSTKMSVLHEIAGKVLGVPGSHVTLSGDNKVLYRGKTIAECIEEGKLFLNTHTKEYDVYVRNDGKFDIENHLVSIIKADDAKELMRFTKEHNVDLETKISSSGSGGLRGGDGSFGNVVKGTMLMVATINQKKECFKWLLDQGADVNTSCDVAYGPGCVKVFGKNATPIAVRGIAKYHMQKCMGSKVKIDMKDEFAEALIAKGADTTVIVDVLSKKAVYDPVQGIIFK